MTFAQNDNATPLVSALLGILRFARPHDTKMERQFCARLVRQIAALGVPVETDGFGNIWASVPAKTASAPSILWSCHVDTVDARQEEKAVYLGADGIVRLRNKKPGRCLGADDGAGVWLLLEMLRARVPGTYVFHRGEEKGRLGSLYVARTEPRRLGGIDAAIAFDRRGRDNIITHQMSERGCSEAFVKSLGRAINSASNGALDYAADDSGSYTDTYSYFDTVPECCNLSVGYSGEHGPNETLDWGHLLALRAAILRADFTALRIERNPEETEYSDWGAPWGSYSRGTYSGGGWNNWADDDWRGGNDARLDDTLASLCSQYPEVASDLLGAYGVSIMDFLEAVDEVNPSAAQSSYRAIMG